MPPVGFRKIADMSRSSSIYSDQSSQPEQKPPQPDHLNASTNGSTNGNESRAASFTPSFMSAHASKSSETLSHGRLPSNPITIPQKPPRRPVGANAEQVSPRPSPGALLILTSGALHPSTLFYLEMLLRRQNLSSIAFTASNAQESALKQLKMDVYALLGKMGKEVGVTIHTKAEWTQAEIESVVQEATKSGTALQGIMCSLELDEDGTAAADFLALETDQLQHSWKQSVAFLHAATRATVPQLLSRCQPGNRSANGISSRTPQGPFFLVTGFTPYTSASHIVRSACDSLILQLERSTKAKGLTVGYAEEMLIPEPVPEAPKVADQDQFSVSDRQSIPLEDQIFTPSESPTKLWNMWALQNDIGYVED
ncbi:Hypothetical predicted protein [Lecanosticta acicola]|uniref:Uncharacterized protein n=1 Tax=Lecanosticta acicola TaxID=111012 RepID=A0AAI8W1N4_9PEZI|nr:Hypothetical predicted protein [Lecanosticta acicola]